MELINQLSWCAYFEQRGNQQRKSLGKWLLEESVQGCVSTRVGRREVHLYWGLEEKEGMFAGKKVHLACIAVGSRLLMALPIHWKHSPKAGDGKKELQAACPFSEGAAWWLEREFQEALSSLLFLLFGGFPLCQKNPASCSFIH